ncbi:MAG: DUF2147 domain-containing protein [Bacteroidota bacterium]
MNKMIKVLPLSLVFMLMAVTALAQSPIGKWKTIDDETNKPKSIVEIYEKDGKLYGKVIKLFREPGEEQNPKCDECDTDDPRYMQPVIGMEILKGLEKDDDEWEDGEILDPKNGSIYDCYIELEGPDKLKVRGYLGVSILGRTQYWYREK